MLPLAVSGTSAIAVVVAGAVGLAWVLLRGESRDDAREQARTGKGEDQ